MLGELYNLHLFFTIGDYNGRWTATDGAARMESIVARSCRQKRPAEGA